MPALRRWLAACAIVTHALAAHAATGHGGGLDKQGCHVEHATGVRHCHREGADPDASVRYVRKEWHPRWADTDGDCQSTRHEVLIEESLVPVTLDARGCKVVAGKWLDPYTGDVFADPRQLDIDHLVPLAEAHWSGGAEWSRERKRRFANDLSSPHTLVAVSAGANRAKGARDPAEWMPPDRAHHCEYVRQWVAVKSRWGLGMDPAEEEKVRQVRSEC